MAEQPSAAATPKVTVRITRKKPDGNYDETLYEQTVPEDKMDLRAVVAVVNGLTKPAEEKK